MIFLAIDTAFSACSVCLYETQTKKMFSSSQKIERGHAEKLMPMIDVLMSEVEIQYQGIDCIAVVNGPGAFTGMRVGISTAKALALSLGKPLIGINSFSAFYYTYLGQVNPIIECQEDIVVILETKRDDFYFAILNGAGEFIIKPKCADKEKILEKINQKKCFLIGDAVDRFTQGLELSNVEEFYKIEYPNLKYLFQFILKDTKEMEKIGNKITPLYLRNADVTMPKPLERFL